MDSTVLLPGITHSEDTPAEQRAEWLALGLLALGLGLRLIHLGEGLWYDEIRTLIEYARQPLGTIVTTYDSQNQHLLFSVLARISILLLGESPAALRLPAVLLGAASLWAVYRLGRRVGSPREALLAMALLTVSYHHVWFSQNARGYTGLLLFTLIATHALWRLLSDPGAGQRVVWLYAVAMALAVYTHITAALVSLAHALVVLALWLGARGSALRSARGPLFALALSGVLGLLLYAPVFSQLIQATFSPAADTVRAEWQRPAWFAAEMIRGLAQGVPGGWLGLAGGGLVAIAGLVSLARTSWALAALLVLPAALTLGATLLLEHNLRPRFVFFSAGFAALIAVRGAFVLAKAFLPRSGERLAAVLLLLAAGVTAFKVPAAWRPKQDFAGAQALVEREAAPGDAVVTVDLTVYPYQEYFRRPWPGVEGVAQLDSIERRHPRTWLLYTFPVSLSSTQPAIWARLQERYAVAGVYPGTVGGGDIVVMVTGVPAPGRRGNP